MKKILFISNYYYPYTSGVTEYEKMVCEKLADDGYEVTVLTSNYAKLKDEEVINKVKVVRAPIIGKISKGTISPAFIIKAKQLGKQADIINMHLPMIESGLISSLVDKKKLVVTYHCDINLPSNALNNIIVKVMDSSNNICLKRARNIIVNTKEYSEQSRVACKYIDKLIEIAPPVKKLSPIQRLDDKDKLIDRNNGIKIIGCCGRIVEEKGIDILIKAFAEMKKNRNDIKLIIGGDYKNVAGGSIYPELKTFIEKNQINDIEFIGKIPEERMSEFYSSLDVFVLPSINSLESFGMVQIEAMMSGVPVVASNLYGVRTIVQKTGMGLIAKVKDVNDLASCIGQVIDEKDKFVKDTSKILKLYSTELTIEKYISCFKKVYKNG